MNTLQDAVKTLDYIVGETTRADSEYKPVFRFPFDENIQYLTNSLIKVLLEGLCGENEGGVGEEIDRIINILQPQMEGIYFKWEYWYPMNDNHAKGVYLFISTIPFREGLKIPEMLTQQGPDIEEAYQNLQESQENQ